MRYNNLDKTYNFAEVRISQERRDTPKYAYVDVKTRRLDGFGFQNVSFIKIDVEGYEIDVLDGCDAVLRQQKPTLLIEAENRHRANAVQSLASYLCNYGYDGFFCCRKKRTKSVTLKKTCRTDPSWFTLS